MSKQTDPSQANNEPQKLCAMGFGDLLDAIFSLYRAHFLPFLAIASGYFVGMLIVISILFLDDSVGRRAMIAIWTPTVIVSFSGFVFMVSGLISASTQAYLIGTVRIGAALRQGIRQFFPCFVSSLLFGLIAIFLAVSLAAVFAIIYNKFNSSDTAWILGGVGIILILIWVTGYFVAYWCFFISPILVEGKSMRASLRRGRDLIRGTWWRIAGMVLVIFLLSFAIGFILRSTFGFLLTLTGGASEDFVKILRMGLWDLPMTRRGLNLSKALMYVINLGADTFTIPIWVIGCTLLYFNQRIRKEGFDIEVMATGQEE